MSKVWLVIVAAYVTQAWGLFAGLATLAFHLIGELLLDRWREWEHRKEWHG